MENQWNLKWRKDCKKHCQLMKKEINISKSRLNHLKRIIQQEGYKKILEVGSGCGCLPVFFHFDKKDYLGLDNSEVSIENLKKNGYKGKKQDLDDFNWNDLNKFDCAIALEVIEHLKRPDLALKTLYKTLNKNGKIFISVPNGGFILVPLVLLFFQRGILLLTPTAEYHYQLFTRGSLKKYLLNAGFKNVKFINDKPIIQKIQSRGNALIRFIKKVYYISIYLIQYSLGSFFPSHFKRNIVVVAEK